MLVEVRRSEQGLEIDLTGEWRALELAQIDAALAGVDLANARRVSIGTKSLTALDLSGAWRVNQTLTVRAGVNNILDTDPPDFAMAVAKRVADALCNFAPEGSDRPAVDQLAVATID